MGSCSSRISLRGVVSYFGSQTDIRNNNNNNNNNKNNDNNNDNDNDNNSLN